MERNVNKENLIDDLISGRLSDDEAHAAMRQINADPALKSDFDFQSELVNQLHEVRKTELKLRLDAIPIEPILIGGLTATGLLKLGGAVITATAIGIGGYLWFSDQQMDDRHSITYVPSKSKTIDLSSTTVAQGPKEIQKFDLRGIQSLPLTASSEAVAPIETEDASASVTFVTPEVVPPTVSTLFEEEVISSPKLDGNKGVELDIKDEAIEIENIKDEKYPFHYKYYNNKLYLYGDFKGIPYEILEVHGKSSRVAYLSYQGQYYQLKNPIKGAKPLIPIGDKDLIKELDILKQEKAF